MEKKILCMIIFLIIFVNNIISAQTWVEVGGDNYFEYTIITMEQWERICRAQENIAASVILSYRESAQFSRTVIQGRRPVLRGTFFISVRVIPQNEYQRLLASYITSTVMYGNTETGIMQITFLRNTGMANTINLRTQWDEYVRRTNQLIRIVYGE